jgi:urease accessory protein
MAPVITTTTMITSTELQPAAAQEAARPLLALAPAELLRLLQLSSSLCPIGAFAYSQGLESAIEQGWIRSGEELAEWLEGVGSHALARLDLPLLARAHTAWERGDADEARQLGEQLASNRESRELYEQDQQLGLSLARLLVNLGVSGAEQLLAVAQHSRVSHVTAYALGSAHFGISAEAAAYGFAFTWVEQQVSAASRLIPLGHMASQRTLSRVLCSVPSWVNVALRLEQHQIGSSTPALAVAAAWHETQYTRLFRS